MVRFLTQLLLAIRSRFTRRARLEAENLILRQQLVVLRRKSPKRVRLWNIDRLLLVWLYRLYPSLLDAIIIVQPETVIRWHRRGFRAYWRWKSRHAGGRPGPEQRIVRARPARGAARRDAQTPAASDDGVGRPLEPAGDVCDGQLVSVELAKQLVLGLAPALGQRSPRLDCGARPWAHSQAAWSR